MSTVAEPPASGMAPKRSPRGRGLRRRPAARQVLRRLVLIVPVVLIVTFASTLFIDLVPGDPAAEILGEQAAPEDVARLRAELGLDRSVLQRYVSWLGDAVRGDLGMSFRTRQPVAELITARLPVTLELAVVALVLALVVSIPIGILTAFRADRRVDRFWSATSSGLISLPHFVLGLVLIYVFALRLEWLPSNGWVKLSDSPGDNLRHVLLPAVTLALQEIPLFSRLLRSDMVATLREDFVLAARAKGMSTRYVLFRHALRPSSFSLVTLAGLSLGRLISGAIVVEVVFGLPGIGQLMINSIFSKDLTVVQGVVAFVAVAYVLINATVDLLYLVLDPRVRSAS